MDSEKSSLPTNNLESSPYLILLIVFIVTCIFFLLYQRKKSAKQGVLLTGLCDSGKTVIFSHLVYGTYVDTQTSMKENLGEFSINNGVLKIIDIPGYERLRGKYFDQYKPIARGIVYVIDSVTLQKNIRDAAEFLYNILSDPFINGNISNILVVCNKQDLALAKSMSSIKNLLEKELNSLRITKSNQLQSLDTKATKKIFLGKEGKDFTFDSLPSLKVEFIEANASSDKPDMNGVCKWLSGLCA